MSESPFEILEAPRLKKFVMISLCLHVTVMVAQGMMPDEMKTEKKFPPVKIRYLPPEKKPEPHQLFAERMNGRKTVFTLPLFREMDQRFEILPILQSIDVGNEGGIVVELGEKRRVQKNGGPLVEILEMRPELVLIVQAELF